MENDLKQSFKQDYTGNIELTVFNCGHQICRPGHTWGPGIRDRYLIHLVVAGEGSFTIGGQTLHIHEGDLFLVKPNQLVSYTADEKNPWEYYWVGFNGACANQLILRTPFSDCEPVYHCRDSRQLSQTIHSIYLNRGLEADREASMVGYLYLFLAELMAEARELTPHTLNTSAQYVLNAIKFIQFNYSHDISIDDIARNVGVSRSHLYRVFMSNVGKSPIDYLTQYRINEACNLLKNSTLSIAEIAVSVGFFDQFYFSRVFKKIMGMPPSRYLASLVKKPDLHFTHLTKGLDPNETSSR